MIKRIFFIVRHTKLILMRAKAFILLLFFLAASTSGCLEDESSQKINRAPEALILRPAQGETFEVGEMITIDGSASVDPDGDELDYMWTLSGLGSPIQLSTKMTDTITIDETGDDIVLSLMVRDSGGLSNEDIVVIYIEPGNRPPLAVITTPKNGGAYAIGSTISFNGLASSDPDNDILSYTWEFGEVGGATYTASQEGTFSLEGLGEGEYTITLTVKDPDKESSTATHTFFVTNLPPVAIITTDENSIFTEDIITLHGDQSYDPEDSALSYTWDFGDNQTSPKSIVDHSWEVAGIYDVTLVVKDDTGQEGTTSKKIEVKSKGPTALFVFKDEGGNIVEKIRANSNITLDASESIAADVEIKEYKWDFGDNQTSTENESTVDHTWSAGAYYDITLVTVDKNDKTGEITKTLQVVPEDYFDEGQDSTAIVQENEQDYFMEVYIFLSSFEIEFTDINCVGVSGQIDYTITVQDSEENEIGQSEDSVACGEEGKDWSIIFINDETELTLGSYEVTIAFTNSGIPVQANWDYRFAIVYDF